MLNSGLWSLYNANFFDYLMMSEDIEAASPLVLDTSHLGIYMPSLIETYGESKPLDLHCRANSAPVIEF